MKKALPYIIIIILCIAAYSIGVNNFLLVNKLDAVNTKPPGAANTTERTTASSNNNAVTPAPSAFNFINPEGMVLAERFYVPDGYTRTDEEAGSLGEFLRNYRLKPDKSPVLLYDGSEKYNQSAHAAVFNIRLSQNDRQQCADSVMRIYAEYLWAKGDYDKIGFHFVNGFYCNYTKWRDGYRVRVRGNNVT
ncbi:MAG TPA: DUF4846 domain-containing protein, partial [Clostridia bacterium]|nr:DUF4846 domain-containing protein [Clostridia bacterium]